MELQGCSGLTRLCDTGEWGGAKGWIRGQGWTLTCRVQCFFLFIHQTHLGGQVGSERYDESDSSYATLAVVAFPLHQFWKFPQHVWHRDCWAQVFSHDDFFSVSLKHFCCPPWECFLDFSSPYSSYVGIYAVIRHSADMACPPTVIYQLGVIRGQICWDQNFSVIYFVLPFDFQYFAVYEQVYCTQSRYIWYLYL